MVSSASSGVYDDYGHMDISTDDEAAVEIVSSDDEDLDDFQPFALLDPVLDGEPIEDDVLAVGPQLNQFVIIGHPDGAHIVDYIPLDVVPLAAVPEIIVVSDDEDDVPVIHVDHLDDEIGDGEALDIVILEVSSPVISVVDISSSDTSDDASSSAIRHDGLRADATDSSFDTISIATQPLAHTPAPVSAPIATPTVVPSDTPTPHSTYVTPTVGHPLSSHVAYPHRVDTPIFFSHGIPAPRPGEGTSRQPTYPDTRLPVDHMSTLYPSPRMSESDPYHPCHGPVFTPDDVTLSLQLQIRVLSRQVWELQQFRDSMPPPPPAYPPPSIPPPPSSPPPPSPPHSRPLASLEARVLTLEQRANLSDTRMSHVLDEMDHLHSLVVPTPPPSPPAP
ncbi:hypothetical protein HanIR_Chr08g0388031 [Helianthus annuus]|nr:hypothetical protein HanIR_Chr08g0388031 [Helianthus annuus]